jgi:hypothetical protein
VGKEPGEEWAESAHHACSAGVLLGHPAATTDIELMKAIPFVCIWEKKKKKKKNH